MAIVVHDISIWFSLDLAAEDYYVKDHFLTLDFWLHSYLREALEVNFYIQPKSYE